MGRVDPDDRANPAGDDICTLWGFSGKTNGLCVAYCEAMDCDAADPQASDQACARVLECSSARVLDKIEDALGDSPFPTCMDVDDDGIPNGLDNCPDVANPAQVDLNPTTPEGAECEAILADNCPCLGAGIPNTTAEILADARAFHSEFGPPLSTECKDQASPLVKSYAARLGPATTFNRWSAWVRFDYLGNHACLVYKFENHVRILIATLNIREKDIPACAAMMETIQMQDPLGICD